ncbi:PREDICTED: saccharopine dehydrogenase-like oxidoreductase, partial [Rhagoletis zephyria]|uniref:saccharopine dehydrogenase-like oxidoreductase n=1 Tax=Rhagoletis zephyria TaxID=28612 RepID=UPI00081128C2
MPTKGNRPYDIVIFGATGVVGYYAIRDLYQSVQQSSEEYASVRWAVAGRRMDKLQQTLAELSEELQVDLSAVPKIIADVLDLPSIETMVKSTKVLLNCVGPYNHYGRAVVDACINARTDHFDLSAELQFIEGTQLDCHEAALNAEVIVVSACGFCSIIPEMGLALARQHFNGTLHSVESYIDFKPGKQVGLTALIDRKMMPRGGVLTAGSAFRETQLWERLQRRGITWQIEEKSPVKTNGK